MKENNNYKFPFFYHKIKAMIYIKNLRHCFLHLGVNITEYIISFNLVHSTPK